MYVQIDPINMCGRMHDLILRNRIAGYREGGLMEHIYTQPRTVIEAKGCGTLIEIWSSSSRASISRFSTRD